MTRSKFIILTISLFFILTSCRGPFPLSDTGDLSSPTLTPFLPAENTPTAVRPNISLPENSSSETITEAQTIPGKPITLWAPEFLPINLPPILERAESVNETDLHISVLGQDPITKWVFALVAPFPTTRDIATFDEIKKAWKGDGPTVYASPETYQVFETLFGVGTAVEANPEELLTLVWEQDSAWAIIPFEKIEPKWKVLSIEGQSPLQNDFNLENYKLAIPFYLDGDEALVKAIQSIYPNMLPPTNRDPDKLTTVAMTGVTALVRATAWTMEQQGITYPARDIGELLRSADITHISNEVPFAENCPFPNPVQAGVTFCSDPRYVQLLQDVGTDVVELTGDHFHDWGNEAMLFTLGMYAEQGWPVYGGGATFEEGREPALLEHNGNKIAFIGCNGKGGGFARASETNPGSVHCDFDWMHAEIERLRGDGYLVIATFQHFEYYSYAVPGGRMPEDFRGMADAGAVVVSGSQAHHPHGFEFRGDGLMHFGLGNTFFDQYGISTGTIQGFIDVHTFYDGRYLGTELVTVQFVDFARARFMTDAERRNLLETVFRASGW